MGRKKLNRTKEELRVASCMRQQRYYNTHKEKECKRKLKSYYDKRNIHNT